MGHIMSRLAVFFPGIGYTVDKPLLYYSRKLAAQHGFDIKLLPYGGFPKKVPGDKNKIQESYAIALAQARQMLSDTDLSSYEEVLFVGKSIGTIAAAQIASESPARDRIRLVLYTPLEETFTFEFGEAVAFTGSRDQWTGEKRSRVPALAAEKGIPCMVIPEANHSLECGITELDLQNLTQVMQETEAFMLREN